MAKEQKLTEEIKSGKLRALVESFQVDTKKEGLVASGVALPLNTRSRNGVSYIAESAKKAVQTLIGAPVLFNHNPDRVVGHVLNAYEDAGQIIYEMDINENDALAENVKRKDVSKVSIQVMFDDTLSYYDQDTDTTHAYITEFLELSLVTIPGFSDTSVMLHEMYSGSENKAKEHASETQEAEVDNTSQLNDGETMTETKEQTKKEDVQSPDDHVTVMEDLTKKLEQTVETVNSFNERLSSIEKKIEAMDDKSDDKEDEEADKDEKDEKKESFTRKSKLNATSQTSEEQTLSTSQFKEAIKGC